MKKFAFLAVFSIFIGLCFSCQSLSSKNAGNNGLSGNAPVQPSFYVKANGDDGNSGLSEKDAYKTLAKALSSLADSSIRVITVIGILDKESENPSWEDYSMINIALKNNEQITIRGKPNATEKEKAVINAGGSDGRVIYITESSNVRLENITICGGISEKGGGIRMMGDDTVLTIAEGTIITGNTATFNGGGISVHSGKLFMKGGKIYDNKTENKDENEGDGLGGGVFTAGKFIMSGGEIYNNVSGHGAGVLIYEGQFILEDGNINGNICGKGYDGGGVFVNGIAEFTMNGGTISGNKADDGGGILNLGSLFVNNGKIFENQAEGTGGGILVNKKAKFTMSGGSISGNKCSGGGGGVHVKEEAEFIMNGGTIMGNESLGGGGIFSQGSLLINNGNICENYVVSIGGGVMVYSGQFIMEDGIIKANKCGDERADDGGWRGGGVYVLDEAEFIMNGGAIVGNEAGWGGGIAVFGNVLLNNGNISGNHAVESGGGVLITEESEFTMTGGAIHSNKAKFGGGIDLEGKARLVASSIFNNQSSGNGGGINVNEPGYLVMSGSKIFNNEATSGGGIIIRGKAELNDTLIINNQSTGNGGGIDVISTGSLVMNGGSVGGNQASQNGGGMVLLGESSISGVTIKGNQAVWGGGIFSGASVLLINCVLSENRAFWGGALITSANAHLEMKDSSILENYAFSGGGGIGMFLVNNETILYNVRITNNKTILGGAIYLGRGASLFINGGVMDDNTAYKGAFMYREKLSKLEFSEYRAIQDNEIFMEK